VFWAELRPARTALLAVMVFDAGHVGAVMHGRVSRVLGGAMPRTDGLFTPSLLTSNVPAGQLKTALKSHF
jgi:hypothetical protein